MVTMCRGSTRQVEAGLTNEGCWIVGVAVSLLASSQDHHYYCQCCYDVGVLLVWMELCRVLTDVLCRWCFEADLQKTS